MSGHSKWANIKHRKEASDKKKGRIFSRLVKEIMVSIKHGGSDPETNTRLGAAIIAARAANMPNDNIDRAIKKASGEAGSENFEEIVYEGYGPSGVAILVECLTDNRNRTAGEIRMIFDRNNGNLAGSGAVTWMFHRKSRFVVTGENATEEKLLDVVLDAGAEDIEESDGAAEILGGPDFFESISKALEKAKIVSTEAGIIRKPEIYVEIKDVAIAEKALRLVEKLEEHDDVQAVYTNLDIADDIIAKID